MNIWSKSILCFFPLLSVHAELASQHSEDFESFKTGQSFEADALPEAAAPFRWDTTDAFCP